MDVLERKRLRVLNQAASEEAGVHCLEKPGLLPDAVDPGREATLHGAIQILHTIYDPEIPVDIYELGLIYGLEVADGVLNVKMTLTSPTCPVAHVLVAQVAERLRRLPALRSVRTELVWDPPWTKQRMSEAARLALNMLD